MICSMIRIFITIKHLKVKKTTEVLIILIYRQKQKSFFPVKSTYLFKMLRGLQLQLFILYNYKFKLYYEKFAAPSECFSLSKGQKTTEVLIILVCSQKVKSLLSQETHSMCSNCYKEC